MLYFENKRRDGEQRDETYDDVYLTQETKDGIQFDKRIDKVRITVHFLKNLVIATNHTIKTRLSLTSLIFRTVISVTHYRKALAFHLHCEVNLYHTTTSY